MRDLQQWVSVAIRAEAEARGLSSVRQIGLKAGVPDKTLRRALDCERDMSLTQLQRIAGALGVTPAFLVAEAERRQAAETGWHPT